MERLKPWALGGLIFGPLLLLSNVKTSFALERPGHSATILLTAVGCFLLLSARLLARYSGSAQGYEAIPLDSVDSARPSPPPSPVLLHRQPTPPTPSRLRLAFLGLIVALFLRVQAIRKILQYPECPGNTYITLLPLLCALLDYWHVRRHQVLPEEPEEIDDSIYDVAMQYWEKSRLRFLVPTALISLSSALLLRSTTTRASTYICPAVTLARHTVAVSRLVSLPLDFAIVFCIHYICHPSHSSRPASAQRPLKAVGYATIITAFLMLVAGLIYYILSPDDRSWMLSMPPRFYSSILKLSFLASITACSICLSIHFHESTLPTAIVVFTVTSTLSITSSWRNTQPFPPVSQPSSILLYSLLTLAFAALLATQTTAQGTSHHHRPLFSYTPGWFYAVLSILFTIRAVTWIAHKSYASFHPVDMLVFEAKISHENYLAYASSSANLSAAVANYRIRYKRHPPPGFDRWYEYATTRNVTIIDEFDRIQDDLMPFWAVPPAEIRERTWRAISNPWNDVAGISVRNGKAEISPNVVPTHRWMLDGIVEMVSHFAEWVPDMDLAFNINDECRVAVPHEVIEGMRNMASQGYDLNQSVYNGFSEKRGDTWKPIPEEPIQDTPFKELSFQRTFFEFGNAACPPGSPARSQRHWDTGNLCTSCAEPHSLGAFLANWTKSADICHQPDLANLHGLYLSPAAFKASHELYPVFSQSKAPGYTDILYPSPWNYMDKIKYDPNDEHPDPAFESKKRTLFWRGATSEGVSPGSGTWKGMSRQRFNHLANNINNTTPPQPVLLPYPFAPTREKLGYVHVPVSTLGDLVSTSVHLVDNIARCGGKDCAEELAEFSPLAPPSDFQSHWSHKYLLDLDGAGFSGRFLPFLESKSLPFKAALFREWYDARLTPWLHFVPLDLRGHGLWATLVYFAGLEGRIKGKMVSVGAHDKEGEMIAEKGRQWAGKVLRKEDMEVYFFRLLLEWGRLTDDRRGEVGFQLD